MGTIEENREHILNAGEVRFRQYGFNKTTMAEIAGDCQMSTANIYRFFENKDAIVAEMVKSCMLDAEATLRDILQRPGLTAAERLEALLIEKLRIAHYRTCEQPKMKEMVKYISCKRQDLMVRHVEVQQSLIAEILADGNRTGEFRVDDVVTTSDLILQALAICKTPIISDVYDLEELEKSVRGIVRLIIQGVGA